MATVTYYFNAYSSATLSSPGNLIDGALSTYASSSSNGANEVLSGNTCPGTNLGTISKVEVRGYGYKTGNQTVVFRLVPKFSGSNGDNHDHYLSASAAWSSYFDITNDSNAPSSWTWSDIENLDLTATIVKGPIGTAYYAKIEILVTYTPGSSAQTVDLTALSSSSSALTASILPGAINVDINALTAAIAALESDILPGAVKIDLSSISTTLNALTFDIFPGAVTIGLDDLTATLDALGLTVGGETSVDLATLQSQIAALNATISGSKQVVLDLLSASLTALDNHVDASQPGVDVQLNRLALIGTAYSSSIAVGDFPIRIVPLENLSLQTGADQMTVEGGETAIQFMLLGLVATAHTTTPQISNAPVVSIALITLQAAATAESLLLERYVERGHIESPLTGSMRKIKESDPPVVNVKSPNLIQFPYTATWTDHLISSAIATGCYQDDKRPSAAITGAAPTNNRPTSAISGTYNPIIFADHCIGGISNVN